MTDDLSDVLGAVADLSTRTTAPSTLGVFDWVTGRRALRGETDQRGGPAPWFGLEAVLRQLETDGLVQILDQREGERFAPPESASGCTGGSVRLRLTPQGRQALEG